MTASLCVPVVAQLAPSNHRILCERHAVPLWFLWRVELMREREKKAHDRQMTGESLYSGPGLEGTHDPSAHAQILGAAPRTGGGLFEVEP